jgi:hypothetical protein
MAPPPITRAVSCMSWGAAIPPQPYRVPAAGDGLGQRRLVAGRCRARSQIALRHRQYSAKAPSRGGMEMICRSAQSCRAPCGRLAGAAGHQRVDRHPPPSSGPPTPSRRPRAEDQRRGRRSSWPRKACMSDPQMPTLSTRISGDPARASGSGTSRIGPAPRGRCRQAPSFRGEPPVTIRTCPVTYPKPPSTGTGAGRRYPRARHCGRCRFARRCARRARGRRRPPPSARSGKSPGRWRWR